MRRRRKNKPEMSASDRIYSLATTALAIVLVLLVITFIYASHRSYSSYINEPHSILSSIDRGDYDDAIRCVAENRANGIDESDDSEYGEPYAVVDYFNAEMDYKMFTVAGDSSGAATARGRMNDAYSKMGNMKFKASEIDSIIAGDSKEK